MACICFSILVGVVGWVMLEKDREHREHERFSDVSAIQESIDRALAHVSLLATTHTAELGTYGPDSEVLGSGVVSYERFSRMDSFV